MAIYQAKNFLTRQSLDDRIIQELGIDIKANKEARHTIEGTRESLKRLQLSDLTTVYGVKVTIIDTPSSQLAEEKRASRSIKKLKR